MDWNYFKYAPILVMLSHTLRGCVDWNQGIAERWNEKCASHPSWVCGLKQWWWLRLEGLWRHTLRGCVDWNLLSVVKQARRRGHTLRGCVDWNSRNVLEGSSSAGHTLRRCVDWNWYCRRRYWPTAVTPFVGLWIETENSFYFLSPLEKVIFTKTCHWLSISYNDKKYDSGLL